jgi:ectoine hydroxylase-related dioxygenase (phytanoyl-CoA dioxygenase family)
MTNDTKSDQGLLSQTQIKSYQDNGYVHVSGLVPSAMIETAVEAVDKLWKQVGENDPDVYWRAHETHGRIADRLDPVCPRCPEIAAIADLPEVKALAATALGGEGALFKDKLITKWPGTAGYLPHQDYGYWESLGIPADEILTVLIALAPMTKETGALEVWPGQHRFGRLPAPADEPRDVDPTAMVGKELQVLELSVGDALAFSSMLPHQSGYNRGAHPRLALYLTFTTVRFAALRDDYYRDTKTYLPDTLRRDTVIARE